MGQISQAILDFISSRSLQRGWTEKTKNDYRTALQKILRENPQLRGTNPEKLSKEQILLPTKRWDSLEPRGRRHYWCIWRQFLEWVGNRQVQRVSYRIPRDRSRDVKWLSMEESAQCRRAAQDLGIEHYVMFHLGRDLGLRRCGKVRLKWSGVNFKNETITFKAKNTKMITLPFHPLTEEILREWEEKREGMLQEAKTYDKSAEDPLTVLAWQKWGGMGSYSDSTADNRLKDIAQRAGIEINGHHTLRRTFARSLYNRGTRLSDIQDLLGHESRAQTKKYIGVQQERGRQALRRAWKTKAPADEVKAMSQRGATPMD